MSTWHEKLLNFGSIESEYDDDGLEEEEDYQFNTRVDSIFTSAVSQLIWQTTNVPFEVINTLMQIQYLPKQQQNQLVESYKEEKGWSSEEEDEDFYEDEIEAEYNWRFRVNEEKMSFMPKDLPTGQTDSYGYLIPGPQDYQIQPMRGGFWNSMKLVIQTQHEGVLSLWKGFIPIFLNDWIFNKTAFPVENYINEELSLYDRSFIPLVHQDYFIPNLLTCVFSRSAIRSLLLPLEVVSVRMIAQSMNPLHMRFSSSLSCLWSFFSRNDSIWQNFRNLYPNFLFNSFFFILSEVLDHFQPLAIVRYFRISPKSSILLYCFTKFGFEVLKSLILMPLDTIRKRRMLYNISSIPEPPLFDTCVAISDQSYTSNLDCFQRILKEECLGEMEQEEPPVDVQMTPDRNTRLKKKRKKTWRSSWLGSVAMLYRGFWFKISLHAIYCSLLAFVGSDLFDGEGDFYYF